MVNYPYQNDDFDKLKLVSEARLNLDGCSIEIKDSIEKIIMQLANKIQNKLQKEKELEGGNSLKKW